MARFVVRIIVSLILCFSLPIKAQKLNFGFEKLSAEGIHRPYGWNVNRYAQNINAVCDSASARTGQYALKIESKPYADTGTFELAFFIEPSQIINKKVDVNTWIKSNEFQGNCGLILEAVGEKDQEYLTLSQDPNLISKAERWTQIKTSLTVPDGSSSILVRLVFQGKGNVYFDDLELKVNGRKRTEVPIAPAFTGEQLMEVYDHSKAFKTVEPSPEANPNPASFEDLSYFKEIVGDARIIALGESTHGTSEFFKLKHRLLQYAALELGVRVFILEDNQLLVERINTYVLTGSGEAERVMKGLFAVWNTQEMLELIKWTRTYNVAHPVDPIEFVGMDVQNPKLALQHLEEFILHRDEQLYRKSYKLLKGIRKNWSQSFMQSIDTLKAWDKAAELNYKLIEQHKEEWLQECKNKADSVTVEWVLKNARTIKQYTETVLGGIFAGRDKNMAENVEWILNQRGKDTKVLIWAHDSHVSRGDAPSLSANYFFGMSMGAYLSDKFDEDYKAFGLFTYQGTCLGTISYSNFQQLPFQIYTSPVGTLDQGLHLLAQKTRQPLLMLNLRPFKNDDPNYAWLNSKRPVRYVGYVSEDYGFGGRYRIPYQFDGILFIDSSTATSKPD